jgi:anti-sigma factor RsiW
MKLDCEEACTLFVDRRRGRLTADVRAAVDAHLAGCAHCRAEEEADARLEQRLRDELPAVHAPASLLARLAAAAEVAEVAAAASGDARRLTAVPPTERDAQPTTTAPPRASRRRRVLATVGPALAVAAALLIGIPAFYEIRVVPARLALAAQSRLSSEAVNDHLRVLAGEQPLSIVSSGIHEVKPWFAGKLDFAPLVRFAGDDAFPLQGGAVAMFLDRKAAAIVYRRRLHTITLLVVRADALAWPAPPVVPRLDRGFHVILWRADELGYALVSDVDAAELGELAARLGAPVR